LASSGEAEAGEESTNIAAYQVIGTMFQLCTVDEMLSQVKDAVIPFSIIKIGILLNW
jgi:hypothetical protein